MTAPRGPASALGDAIRRRREAYNVSMRQFAAIAGISNPYLSQIERGLREPSQRVLDSIARSLETSADALYAQAGVTPVRPPAPTDVREALRNDTALTARQRRALLEIYDGLVAASRREGAWEGEPAGVPADDLAGDGEDAPGGRSPRE